MYISGLLERRRDWNDMAGLVAFVKIRSVLTAALRRGILDGQNRGGQQYMGYGTARGGDLLAAGPPFSPSICVRDRLIRYDWGLAHSPLLARPE
jgi:hypothetical protein